VRRFSDEFMVTLTSPLSMSCHRVKPFQTVHRFDSNHLKVWKFIRDEIGLGHKFIVYPLIQESAKMDFKI
jgi:RecG-like helicase